MINEPSLNNRRQHSRGTILIVAMWIVILLAGLVLVFTRSVRVEMASSANYAAGLQAEAAARGALQFILAQTDGTDGYLIPDCGDDGEAIEIGSGFVWVLKPGSVYDDTEDTFGVRDEASRLNLNTATSEMLLAIPNLPDGFAEAAITWRGTAGDDTPVDEYLMLDDPYYCKHAPFETIEELLLVRDATPELIYGNAAARSAYAEVDNSSAWQDDAFNPGGTFPVSLLMGQTADGLFDYLTVYSREPNTGISGERKTNVNSAGNDLLSELLSEIVPQSRLPQVMSRIRNGRPFDNIFDFYFRSELTFDEFSMIADSITTREEEVLQGLVNVNTAPCHVLLCLPGLDEGDVDAIIQGRQSYNTDTESVAWVANVLDREKLVGIGGLITVRSFQFSADILAVSGNGRAFRCYRAVIDATTSPPRVLYWKDLTHQGWRLDTEILRQLRTENDTEGRIL